MNASDTTQREPALSKLKFLMRWLFGLLFILAGLNHFRSPDFYVHIMPPYLPWHLELVYVSGLFEVVLGALLLVPKTHWWSAWGLIALLVAVFPANLHMALNTDQYSTIPPFVLWLRLPLQAVLIAWTYWFTREAGLTRQKRYNASAPGGTASASGP